MKQMKFRLGAAGLGGALAAATVVSAIALQNDRGPVNEGRDSATISTIEDEPIRYTGGWGLYPNIR